MVPPVLVTGAGAGAGAGAEVLVEGAGAGAVVVFDGAGAGAVLELEPDPLVLPEPVLVPEPVALVLLPGLVPPVVDPLADPVAPPELVAPEVEPCEVAGFAAVPLPIEPPVFAEPVVPPVLGVWPETLPALPFAAVPVVPEDVPAAAS